MKVNDNLRELRLSRNLTQEQVAEKLNVTRQTVSSYESGRTRPDIDTLVRYSEIFSIDLESIIYGGDKTLKANRCVKLVSEILFTVLALLVFAGSLSYLFANLFFPLADGFVGEPPFEWQTHWNLVEAWKVFDTCVNTVSFIGFSVLFVMLVIGKNGISIRTKLIYSALLSTVLMIIPIVCGVCDPKFSPQEYMLTEVLVVIRLWILLGIEELILFVKKRKHK